LQVLDDVFFTTDFEVSWGVYLQFDLGGPDRNVGGGPTVTGI